jgi:hypothetical protein
MKHFSDCMRGLFPTFVPLVFVISNGTQLAVHSSAQPVRVDASQQTPARIVRSHDDMKSDKSVGVDMRV